MTSRARVLSKLGAETHWVLWKNVFFWNIFKTKRFTKKLKRMKFIALVISYIMDLI